MSIEKEIIVLKRNINKTQSMINLFETATLSNIKVKKLYDEYLNSFGMVKLHISNVGFIESKPSRILYKMYPKKYKQGFNKYRKMKLSRTHFLHIQLLRDLLARNIMNKKI